jgi:hypothetical protein
MQDNGRMEPTVLAYLAGVIDSDGYISTQRSMHSGRLYSAARVGIAGTRREPHDLAASLFGGNIYRYVPKDPRHRAQFQWSRCGDGAVTVIQAVLPYLRVKRRQAELAIALQELVWELPWLYPSRCDIALDEMHADMRALNQSRKRAAA